MRQTHILVQEVLDDEQKSRFTMERDHLAIVVPNPSVLKETRIAVLCHELGHAVGVILQLPGALNDSRLRGRGLFGYTDDVIQSEEEAWRIAEIVFQDIKRRALKSYYDTQSGAE